MSIGFKWGLLFHCLKIEACSENTQTISGGAVRISSWLTCPLQHAEHLKNKKHRNHYRAPEKGFYPNTVLLLLLPFVELSC